MQNISAFIYSDLKAYYVSSVCTVCFLAGDVLGIGTQPLDCFSPLCLKALGCHVISAQLFWAQLDCCSRLASGSGRRWVFACHRNWVLNLQTRDK